MKLTTAWFTTNRSCNNRCEWCYAKNTLSTSKVMDFEKAKKAVDVLKMLDVKKIVLIGGEPTIYKHFIPLVKYIRAKGLKVSLATNGRKFANMKFAEDVADAGITNIDISLKGLTEEEYQMNTKSTGLKEMIMGYHNLKSIGMNPSVSYVVISDDKVKFNEFAEFIKRNKISRVLIQFVKPVIGPNTAEGDFTIDKMGKFVKYIYEVMTLKQINYSIEISFPLCLIDSEILEKLILENRIGNCCHISKGTGIIFDQDFKVLPCNHFAEYPFSEEVMEFYGPEEIEKYLEKEEVSSFRKFTRFYPAEKCKECNLWLKCGGGCFTRWLSSNPEDYIK